MTLIRFEDQDFPIQWSKRRRTIGIQIKDEQLSVRAPFGTEVADIQAFVESKKQWIRKHLGKQNQQAQEVYRLAEGACIPILGESKQLVYFSGSHPAIKVTDQHIQITVPKGHPNANLVAAACVDFHLQQIAQKYIPAKASAMAAQLGLEHRLNKVTFKKTKSKWGHCTHDGRLQFNYLIMLCPPPVVDYLIAHEVSHLKFIDHSENFWQTVAQLDPEYIHHRRWLRQQEHKLWLAF